MKNTLFVAALSFAVFNAGCSSSYEQVGCCSGDLKCDDLGQVLMRCDYLNEWQTYYDCARDERICLISECVAPEYEKEEETPQEAAEKESGEEPSQESDGDASAEEETSSEPEKEGSEEEVWIDPLCGKCASDADCGDDMYCRITGINSLGTCMHKCASDGDCGDGFVCEDGRCKGDSEKCDCGGSCPQGYVCDSTYCMCVLNCPQCGANECCDASTAPNCYQCSCKNPLVCGLLTPECCSGYHCSACIYGVAGFCVPD